MRTLAVFAVICLHTDPFLAAHMDVPTPATDAMARLINGASRFAVPFFFAVSGYLAGASAARGPLEQWAHSAARLMWIFAFWSLCYALFPQWERISSDGFVQAVRTRLDYAAQEAARAPLLFLLQGTERHLWFLPALALSSLLTATCAERGAWPVLLLTGGGLYALGLAGQGYAALYDLSALQTRNGPFMGTLLYALGWLAARRPPLPLRTSVLLAAGGLAMQFLEIYTLEGWFQMPVANYYVGTVPLTAGLLDAARRLPHLGQSWGLAWCGPYVLGIYGVHILVMRLVYKLHTALGKGVAWQLAFPTLVFGFSLLIALAGARAPLLRRIFR